MNQKFSPEEFLIIAYSPKEGDIFSKQSLQNIAEISAKIQKINRVKSVRSVMNVPLLSKAGQGLSADMDPNDFTQSKLPLPAAELRSLFKDHPIYDGLLINHEQTATGIQIRFKSNLILQNLDADILAIQAKRLEGPLSKEDKVELKRLKAKAAPLEKALRETRNQEIESLRSIIKDYSDEADLYLGGVHVLGYQLINIIQND